MTIETRLAGMKRAADELCRLTATLHGTPVGAGGYLKVYTTSHVRTAVEFFRVTGHTQRTLAGLGVLIPVPGGLPQPAIEGVFYDYDDRTRMMSRVRLTADTPQEAFDKILGCLAPLIDYARWSPPGGRVTIPLAMADFRH